MSIGLPVVENPVEGIRVVNPKPEGEFDFATRGCTSTDELVPTVMHSQQVARMLGLRFDFSPQPGHVYIDWVSLYTKV